MRYTRRSDTNSADLLLLQFCRLFEDIYGEKYCTINMHLHCHIVKCVQDYGPVHAFWCYAFERYNGILGAVHTNGKAIESQLMKKFCLEQEANNLQLPPDKDFLALLPCDLKKPLPDKSNVTEVDISKVVQMTYSSLENDILSFSIEDAPIASGLPPYHEKVLSGQLHEQLKSIYAQLYPAKEITHMSYFYREYGRIELGGDLIGSVKPGANNSSSSIIMAKWPSTGSLLQALSNEKMGVGEVQYFIKHSIKVGVDNSHGEIKNESHVFAYVHWKKLHEHQNWFGASAIVCLDIIEEPNACCFIPAQRIYARCAFAQLPVTFPNHVETVFIACPLPIRYSL